MAFAKMYGVKKAIKEEHDWFIINVTCELHQTVRELLIQSGYLKEKQIQLMVKYNFIIKWD